VSPHDTWRSSALTHILASSWIGLSFCTLSYMMKIVSLLHWCRVRNNKQVSTTLKKLYVTWLLTVVAAAATTPLMALSVTCIIIVSLTPFWGICEVTSMINNFVISVTWSWRLAFKCTYSDLGISMFDSVMRCTLMLRNALQVDKSVLREWHLILVCSRMSSSCILQCQHMTLVISLLKISSWILIRKTV
jgi:hypothetical protein